MCAHPCVHLSLRWPLLHTIIATHCGTSCLRLCHVDLNAVAAILRIHNAGSASARRVDKSRRWWSFRRHGRAVLHQPQLSCSRLHVGSESPCSQPAAPDSVVRRRSAIGRRRTRLRRPSSRICRRCWHASAWRRTAPSRTPPRGWSLSSALPPVGSPKRNVRRGVARRWRPSTRTPARSAQQLG